MNQKAIVFNSKDNVAIALDGLKAGESAEMAVDDRKLVVTVIETIPFGHKFSLMAIESNQPIIKYGEIIGIATCNIRQGAYVHVHNVASARGRGDLAGGKVQ